MPAPTAGEPGPPELSRRWERLWAGMDEAQLSCLVIYGAGALGQYGDLAYVAGTHVFTKGLYAVLRRWHPPVLVASSDLERNALLRSGTLAVDVVAPEATGRAHQLALVRRLCADSAVAVTGPGRVPHSDGVSLHVLFGHTLPMVDLVAEARRALTEQDRAEMCATGKVIEETYESLVGALRPKDTERDVAAIIESQLVRRGSCVRVVHVSAGHFHGQAPTDTVLGVGDLVTLFIESAGPTGHWVELGVLAPIGTPSRGHRHQVEVLQSALRDLGRQLLPGRNVSTIATSAARAVAEHGTRTIGLGHGTGIDEQSWQLSDDVDRPLHTDEAVAVHPSIEFADGTAAAVANTYFVGPGPAEPVSHLPFTTLALPRI